ncbi:MAG TPA: response regulator [Nitrospirota bacterium]|nr:response regulator [Nitrospirota bacterium]
MGIDHSKSILVVDDEYLMRYSLSSIFKNAETDVTTAADGASALHTFEKYSFDLCLLDIQLPDMSGLDIMKKIRYISPRTIIVIMTGSDVSHEMMKSIRDNAHCLISKSFDLLQVKALVDVLISNDKPLCHHKSAAIRDQISFITWLADDIRKHTRKLAADRICCWAVAPKSDKPAAFLTADVLDISDTGMCILTDYELKPGHILLLSDITLQKNAVIRWSEFTGTTASSYRAGLQFVPPEFLPR